MKHYVYVVTKKNNDRSGNPRSTIRVWDMSAMMDPDGDGYPRIAVDHCPIGYRDADQAAVEELANAGFIDVPATKFGGLIGIMKIKERGIANIKGVS